MSIFDKLNPFRRRQCCAVPWAVGYFETGGVVSGAAELHGATIHWVGIVQHPTMDYPAFDDALEAAEQVLVERLKKEQS